MPDAIQHIIVLMMENRSFDHMLGAIPGVDGVDPGRPFVNVDPRTGQAFEQLPNAVDKLSPDPAHATKNVLRQINVSGAPWTPRDMTGFVADFVDEHPRASRSRQQVMSYYSLGHLPAMHQLAQNFCVCDQWFSSVPGPTWTNRFFAHSGTSQGWVEMPKLPFRPNLHRYDQVTIYDRLNERGIPWRIYAGDIPQSLLLYNQRKRRNAVRYSRMSTFFEDVARSDGSSFPAYVFIEPSYLPFGQNDQHPPSDVLKGDDLIGSVYQAVRNNSRLWESTLLIITYDEHGGFCDHAVPPNAIAPDAKQQEGFDFTLYGARVPAILISPWVRPGVFRASWGVLDHTSILRYLTEKFNLGPLGNRTASAASFADAITGEMNRATPERIPVERRDFAEHELIEEPVDQLNPNQAALIDFTRHLEIEGGTPPETIGLRAIRAAGSPQGEIETAKERVWEFLDREAR